MVEMSSNCKLYAEGSEVDGLLNVGGLIGAYIDWQVWFGQLKNGGHTKRVPVTIIL